MPARCVVLNVEPSWRIPISNGTARRRSPDLALPFRLGALRVYVYIVCPLTRSLFAEVFGNSPLFITGPKLLNLSAGAALSPSYSKSVSPCATELLHLHPATPSCGTDNALSSFQQLIPYPER
jgi:hypothetical protein